MSGDLKRVYDGLAVEVHSKLAQKERLGTWDELEEVLGQYFAKARIPSGWAVRRNSPEPSVRLLPELLKRHAGRSAFVIWAAASGNSSRRTRDENRIDARFDQLTQLAQKRMREGSLLLVGFTVALHYGPNAVPRGAEYVQYGRIVMPRELEDLRRLIFGRRVPPPPL